MTVPVIQYDHIAAARAFEVHAALVKAQRDNPRLADNPIWTMMKQDAFERFSLAFERA